MTTQAKQPPKTEETALTVVSEINKKLAEYKQQGYIVLGVPTIQQVPPMHRLIIKTAKPEFEMDNKGWLVSSPDLYLQAGGSVAFRRNFYDYLADTAGIQWEYHAFRRMDDGRDRRFCHYQAVGLIKGMDGQWRPVVGDKAIHMDDMEQELRNKYRERAETYVFNSTATDVPAAAKKDAQDFVAVYPTPEARARWVESKVETDGLQVQKHIVQRAQTGAQSRVVEKALALRKSYKLKELEKGFVFGIFVFTPDENHAGDREWMRNQADRSRHTLGYPPPPAAPQTESHDPKRVYYPEVEAETVEPLGGFRTTPEPAASTQAQVPPTEKPAAAEPSTHPAPDDRIQQMRADFLAADARGQVEVLENLIQKKGYKGKITGEMIKWGGPTRTSFFDKLVKMPDAQATAENSAPLPFED